MLVTIKVPAPRLKCVENYRGVVRSDSQLLKKLNACFSSYQSSVRAAVLPPVHLGLTGVTKNRARHVETRHPESLNRVHVHVLFMSGQYRQK